MLSVVGVHTREPLSSGRIPQTSSLTNPCSGSQLPPRLLRVPSKKKSVQGPPRQLGMEDAPQIPRTWAAFSGGGEAAAHAPHLPGRPRAGWGDGTPEKHPEPW